MREYLVIRSYAHVLTCASVTYVHPNNDVFGESVLFRSIPLGHDYIGVGGNGPRGHTLAKTQPDVALSYIRGGVHLISSIPTKIESQLLAPSVGRVCVMRCATV